MELMALSTKVCSKCGRELPDSEFYPHRRACKSCESLRKNKGYVKGNVHWISRRANRIKSDATVEELEKIISYMKDNDGE